MFEPIEVITTTATAADARAIARALVDARLAACVQVEGPLESTYRWEGRTESSQEWRCVAKTARRCYRRVEEVIRKIHPYELPQIVAIPIITGSQSYLDWLRSELDSELVCEPDGGPQP